MRIDVEAHDLSLTDAPASGRAEKLADVIPAGERDRQSIPA